MFTVQYFSVDHDTAPNAGSHDHAKYHLSIGHFFRNSAQGPSGQGKTVGIIGYLYGNS